ncbi:MAG: class I SAM-dependent methyltransferase [Spirochaetes bacterium]|nr:class I SAM-dependent methyltransferase [Spirochaetota bacterium]
MQRSIKEIFDSVAETYQNDWVNKKKEVEKIRGLVKKFGLDKGMKVVEAGCGKGDFSPYILEHIGLDGFLWMVDISGKMLKFAENKMVHISNSRCLLANIENVELEQKIDMVICFNCFPHFENKTRTLKNIYHLLKKKGLLVISHSQNREHINKMHREFGFEMRMHHIPDKSWFDIILKKTGFLLEKYVNNGYFLVKARKI